MTKPANNAIVSLVAFYTEALQQADLELQKTKQGLDQMAKSYQELSARYEALKRDRGGILIAPTVLDDPKPPSAT